MAGRLDGRGDPRLVAEALDPLEEALPLAESREGLKGEAALGRARTLVYAYGAIAVVAVIFGLGRSVPLAVGVVFPCPPFPGPRTPRARSPHAVCRPTQGPRTARSTTVASKTRLPLPQYSAEPSSEQRVGAGGSRLSRPCMGHR